jgi:hypothetical protein
MPTTDARHSRSVYNHPIENFTFADAAARAAGTGYTIVAADIGKVAYQQDTGVYYRLTAIGPLTWAQITGTGTSSGAAGGDLTGTYPNPTVNIDGKTSKATPVDADETLLADSAASFATKKLTWANIKATLKTYFDGLYQAAGSYLTAPVANASLANMAAKTFKGRHTNSTGAPEDVSATNLTADLDAMVGDSGSGGTKGLVPAPAAGDAAAGKFLKSDGTWAAPSGGGGGTLSCVAVYHNTTQTISGSSTGTIAFNSETEDTDGYHDNTTNNGRLTIPTGMGGTFLLMFSINVGTDTAHEPVITVRKNGTTVVVNNRSSTMNVDGSVTVSYTGLIDLADGDYIELRGIMSGSSKTMDAGTAGETQFGLLRVGGGGSTTTPTFHGCRVTRSSNGSVFDASTFTAPFDGEDFDTDGYHDNTTNNSRITIPTGKGGYYLVEFSFLVSCSNSTGTWRVTLDKNSGGITTLLRVDIANLSKDLIISGHAVIALVAGDYIECKHFQSSGTTQTILNTAYPSWFSATLLGV